MPGGSNPQGPKSWVDELPIPPTILVVGSVIWKVVSVLSNIQFVMSIQNDTFRILFESFEDYGWWVLILISLFWFLAINKKGIKKPSPASTVFAASFIAFLFGILLTVHATGHMPRIIVEWGGDRRGCRAVFDTSRLRPFQEKYEIALVCGIEDPSTDRLKNAAITISSPYTIVPGILPIFVPLTETMAGKLAPINTIWHEAILIPKDTYLPSITTLNDVVKRGGKILNPGLWELKASLDK